MEHAKTLGGRIQAFRKAAGSVRRPWENSWASPGRQ